MLCSLNYAALLYCDYCYNYKQMNPRQICTIMESIIEGYSSSPPREGAGVSFEID